MSESIKISGKAHLVEETKEYGSNGFQKRLIVIDVVDGQYSNKIPVEAVKDKCSMFDDVRDGDAVTAFVNMRSNEWKDKFFLSLQCWKIETNGSAVPTSERVRSGEADQPKVGAEELPDCTDDVPF